MHIEIQVALNFVISYLYNKLPRRRVNIFGEELEKALKQKFQGHWYPDKPFKVSIDFSSSSSYLFAHLILVSPLNSHPPTLCALLDSTRLNSARLSPPSADIRRNKNLLSYFIFFYASVELRWVGYCFLNAVSAPKKNHGKLDRKDW